MKSLLAAICAFCELTKFVGTGFCDRGWVKTDMECTKMFHPTSPISFNTAERKCEQLEGDRDSWLAGIQYESDYQLFMALRKTPGSVFAFSLTNGLLERNISDIEGFYRDCIIVHPTRKWEFINCTHRVNASYACRNAARGFHNPIRIEVDKRRFCESP